MKYLIYARISPRGSDFEGETSIPMQIECCREYAKLHGGEVVRVLQDEFASGKDLARPGIRELLAEMESGRAEWDTVLVYKLSRLTRSLRDGSALFDKLFKWAKGLDSATERLDFSTPSGRFHLGIMSAVNQLEREQISENTRNKMMSIASHGLWPCGNAPMGYKRGERKDNKLYVEERGAERVKALYGAYAKGETLHGLAKAFGLCKQSVYRVLRNRIYIGMIDYGGKVFPGQHEPIVSADVFAAVQARLPHVEGGRRIRPARRKRDYLLGGLMRCSCGRYMTPSSAKSGRHHYYRCTDSVDCGKLVNAAKVEAAAMACLKDIKVDPSFKEAMASKIRALHDAWRSQHEPELDSVRSAMRSAAAERESVYRKYVAEEDKAALKFLSSRLGALSLEIERLQGREDALLCHHNALDIDPGELAEEMFLEASNLAAAIELASDAETRRMVFMEAIEEIRLMPNGEYEVKLRDSSPNRKGWRPGQESNLRPAA